MRDLRDWERKLQVSEAEWLSEANAMKVSGMGALHLRMLVVSDDIERAYSPSSEAGYNRASLERFLIWREGLPRWRKAARLMFFWIRLA